MTSSSDGDRVTTDLARIGPVADVTFECSAESARLARRAVLRALDPVVDSDTVDTAVLLTSELVTNSLLHARSSLRLVVRVNAEAVRVEVHDTSALIPQQRHYRKDAATGRGLHLVDSLAARWGADETGDGKAVWFEIHPTG